MSNELADRIVVNPQIMTGKPVVRGTRIPVELVLRKLAQNPDVDELLLDYPRLTRDDIRACLEYAYAIVHGEDVFPTLVTASQMVRLLFDESVELRIAEYMHSHGHDVAIAGRDYPASIVDSQVLAVAHSQQRVLITNDTDFGELVIGLGMEHSGVILLRLDPLPVREKGEHLARVLDEFADQTNGFIVVSASGVRVRRRRRGTS